MKRRLSSGKIHHDITIFQQTKQVFGDEEAICEDVRFFDGIA
jgi:hypothetical protein